MRIPMQNWWVAILGGTLLLASIVVAQERSGAVLAIPDEERKRANPVPATAESIDNGKLLFSSQCAMCHGANGDGSGSQKIADPQVAARDASWAPDGSKVAFVIDSPRFANRTHVAVHDVAMRRVSYNDRESPLGVHLRRLGTHFKQPV